MTNKEHEKYHFSHNIILQKTKEASDKDQFIACAAQQWFRDNVPRLLAYYFTHYNQTVSSLRAMNDIKATLDYTQSIPAITRFVDSAISKAQETLKTGKIEL